MIDYSAAGFTLLQGAHLYAPEDRGICDVLIANGKIIAVASNIPSDIVPDCTVVDLSRQILCPGFIDQRLDADRRLSCPFPHYYGFRGKRRGDYRSRDWCEMRHL